MRDGAHAKIGWWAVLSPSSVSIGLAVSRPAPRAAVKLASGSVMVRVGISQSGTSVGSGSANSTTTLLKKLSFFSREVMRSVFGPVSYTHPRAH